MTDRAPFLRLIVVGVDGSVGARHAVEWASQLASISGATVLAVHVLTYNRELMRDITPDTMRTWRRDLERDLESTWIAPLTTAGGEHRTELVEADSAAEGLLNVAGREDADVLIVGSRGHSGIAGRLLGSTSFKLAHHAHQPVIVVPAGERPKRV